MREREGNRGRREREDTSDMEVGDEVEWDETGGQVPGGRGRAQGCSNGARLESTHLYMSRPIPSIHLIAKHLIIVGINHDTFEIRFAHESIKRIQLLEPIGYDQCQTRFRS